jgi:hypothetical protein
VSYRLVGVLVHENLKRGVMTKLVS